MMMKYYVDPAVARSNDDLDLPQKLRAKESATMASNDDVNTSSAKWYCILRKIIVDYVLSASRKMADAKIRR